MNSSIRLTSIDDELAPVSILAAIASMPSPGSPTISRHPTVSMSQRLER
jgi:hypothetical protein